MMGFPAAAMLAGAGLYWLQKHSRRPFRGRCLLLWPGNSGGRGQFPRTR